MDYITINKIMHEVEVKVATHIYRKRLDNGKLVDAKARMFKVKGKNLFILELRIDDHLDKQDMVEIFSIIKRNGFNLLDFNVFARKYLYLQVYCYLRGERR